MLHSNFLMLLAIVGGITSRTGASEVDYQKVNNYKTVLKDVEKDLGEPLEKILTAEDKVNMPSSHDTQNSDDPTAVGDADLLGELKEKVQYLESILDKKYKRQDVLNARDVPLLPPRNTVTRKENQRATVTRNEDQRATVTRNENQRATVTRNENQRATVTRNENQRATVTRNEDQRTTVTKDEDQRAAVKRDGTILSIDDTELIKKLKSKILQLKAILQRQNNKGTAEEIRNIVQPDDQKSHKIHSGATSSKNVDLGDAELLKTIQRKIQEYQKLHAQEDIMKNSQKAASNDQIVKEGTFGNFETSEEKWEDTPLPDNQLGVSTEQKPSENMINEVQRRLLSDMRFAKENGVDIKELLRTLKKKQARSVRNNELELDLEGLSQQETK